MALKMDPRLKTKPPNELFGYCKIVSISAEGELIVNKYNVDKLISSITVSQKMPTVTIAVIGPPGSKKSFWTNLFINYYQWDNKSSWLNTMIHMSQRRESFIYGCSSRYCNLPDDSSPNLYKHTKEDEMTCGIFAWPEPFLTTSRDNCPLLVWILYLHHPGIDGNNAHLQALERFLMLSCSRLMEIKLKNENYRILKEVVDLSGEKSFMSTFCNSVVYMSYVESSTEKPTKSLEKEKTAKTALAEMVKDLEDFKKFNADHLDTFKYLRMFDTLKIDKTLENGRLKLSDDLLTSLDDAVSKVLCSNEIVVKYISSIEKYVSVSDTPRSVSFCSFLKHCADKVNELNTYTEYIRHPAMPLYSAPLPPNPHRIGHDDIRVKTFQLRSSSSSSLIPPSSESIIGKALSSKPTPSTSLKNPIVNNILPEPSTLVHLSTQACPMREKCSLQEKEIVSYVDGMKVAKDLLEILKTRVCHEVNEVITNEDTNMQNSSTILHEILKKAETGARQLVEKKYKSQWTTLYLKIEKHYSETFRTFIVRHMKTQLITIHYEMMKKLEAINSMISDSVILNVASIELQKAIQKLKSESAPIETILLLRLGYEMYMEHYKQKTIKIIQNEERVAEEHILKALNSYNEQMKRLTTKGTNNNIYHSEKLREIHDHMVQILLVELYDSCKKNTTHNIICQPVQKKLKELEVTFEQDFEQYFRANRSRLKIMAVKTSKLFYKRVMTRMMDEEPDLLLDSMTLLRNHIATSKTACSLLEAASIWMWNEESLEEHLLTSICSYASNHWHHHIYPQLEKKQKEIELVNSKKVKSIMTNLQSQSQKDIDSSKLQIATSFSFSPIVFYITSKWITMGMMEDGKPKILKNSSQELSTPFIVGLTNDGDCVYGSEVLVLQEKAKIKKYWWIAENLLSSSLHGDDDLLLLEDILKLKGNGDDYHQHHHLRKISIELLFGFILKKLKQHVESTLYGSSSLCSTAVITIPMWYSSSQRIRVKDAGKIAGFSKVVLMNEGSAAAFACASSSKQGELHDPSNILILSEHDDCNVDASLYSVASSSKLTMIGHCGNYAMDDKKSVCVQLNDSEKFELIKIMIDKTIVHSDYTLINKMVVCYETDSWGEAFNKFQKKASLSDNIVYGDYENAVIVGAILLSKNNLKEINEVIQDQMALDLFCHLDGARDAVKVFDKNTLLPVSQCKIPKVFTPANYKGVRVFQYIHKRKLYIGKLAVSHYFPSKYRIRLHFLITNEAIIELKNVYLSNPIENKWELLHQDLYRWEMSNLSIEDLELEKSFLEMLL